MNKYISSLILALITPCYIFSQATNEDVLKKLNELFNEEVPTVKFELVQKNVDHYKHKNSDIESVKDLKDALSDSPANVENKGSLKIDRINFVIHNGAIRQLEVICTKAGTTSELRFYRDSPISLLRWPNYDRSFIANTVDPSKYLIMRDVIRYVNNLGHHNVPLDRVITITEEKNTENIPIRTSIDQEITFSVFTDLLGLFGDESNGLLDFELSSRFTLNPKFVSNKNHTWLSAVKPYIKYSRFDNSVDSLIIEKDSTFSTRLPSQLSYINFGSTLDLLYYDLWNLHEFSFVTGYRGMLSKYRKNSDPESKESILLLNEIILPLSFDLTINSFNRFNAKFSVYWNYVLMNINDHQANLENSLSVRYNFDLTYSSHNNPNNKLFTRVHFYHELNKSKEFFYNFQVGAKFSLNTLFNVNDKSAKDLLKVSK